ncbi:MAG TPA: DUF2380 domain-containing protein [Methylocella sp.]|nr:DUF2380 domain-containing protein [Methylocella sp.]
MPTRLSPNIVYTASTLLLLGAPAGAADGASQPKPIGIVDFDYADTSSEVRDQAAKHRALLEAFMASLRRDLEASGRYRLVPLNCEPEPCSTANPEVLLGAARRAGAALMLYGGIHKESTLVQWAKVQMADVPTDTAVYDRLYTFRGDDDTAWNRAEAFLATDLKAQDFGETK